MRVASGVGQGAGDIDPANMVRRTRMPPVLVKMQSVRLI